MGVYDYLEFFHEPVLCKTKGASFRTASFLSIAFSFTVYVYKASFEQFLSESCINLPLSEQLFKIIINVTNSRFIKQVNNVSCFILPQSENCENKSFALTGGSWNKSATVITESPADVFLQFINISQTLDQYLSINELIP